MRIALIFLRSFGDFTIAIAVLRKSSMLDRYIFYASKHLEPLYVSLKKTMPDIDLNIFFFDIGIKKKVFGFFTNKHSFELHAFKELVNLKRWLRGMRDNDFGFEGSCSSEMGAMEFFFEQRRKQWFIAPFLGETFPYIHKKTRNIYQSYFQHFDVEPGLLLIQRPTPSKLKKILVLPESRKLSKSFKPLFVNELTKVLLNNGLDVATGFFKNVPFQTEGKIVIHEAFSDLICLIKEADFVVTADSLPAHLAQLFGKPHFVYFEGKPDQEWVTPFCDHNKTYGMLGDLNPLQTFLKAG